MNKWEMLNPQADLEEFEEFERLIVVLPRKCGERPVTKLIPAGTSVTAGWVIAIKQD